MGVREAFGAAVRAFADKIGTPSFAGTPFPTGGVATPAQLTEELGGAGTFNFGGFIRGEDFNPQMDAQTAIKNFDEMRRSDSQVHAALEVVKLPIRTADYEVDPANPDDPQSVAVAKFVEWNLFEGMTTTWDDVIRQALLMLDFGFMLFEKVWTVAEDGPYKGRIVLRKLAARQPRTLWQWFTDDDGSLISIKQLAVKGGTYQFLDVPASKLVRFTFQQEGDNFTGISMLRSAYPHWLIKKQLYVIDAIRATRFGVGIPRAKLKQGYKPTHDDKLALSQMLQGLSSHQHAYVIQPEQVEIDILMPQGVRGGVEVLSSIEHQNEQITRNILAQFLDMGGQANGGSRALGASAMDFFLNAIESIANQICDVITKQLIKDLVDMNFTVSEYPKLRAVGINEPDAQALSTAAAALTAAGLMTAGDRKTENTFRSILNLPELSDEAQPGQPGVPGAPGTPPPGGGPPGTPPNGGPTPATASGPTAHQATPSTTASHPADTTIPGPTHAATTVTQQAPAVKAPNQARAEFEDGIHQPVIGPPAPPPPAPLVPAPTLAFQPVIGDMEPGAPRDNQQPEWKSPAEGAHMRPLVPDAPPQGQPANTEHDPRQPHEAVTTITTPTTAITPNAGPVAPSGVPNVAAPVEQEPMLAVQYVPPTATMARSSVPSSGDADEEGHSWTPPATFQQRVEASARGKTLLTEGRSKKSPTASDEPWRTPTPLEARVLELRDIPRRLDTARTDLLATLNGVREEQILRIASAVAHAAPDADLKAPLVGKMASDIEKAAKRLFEYGHEQVASELRKQRGHALAEFDESKHPRDDHGRFTDGHAEFRQHFAEAFKDSPYKDFVSHYTVEEMAAGHMVPLLANDGKTGLLVHDHGDGRVEATSLYNNSPVKGAGLALLREAVEKHGVNYVEAYGPYLPAIYATLGFETRDKFAFDPKLAAPTWNTAKFDSPDYHIMHLKGGSHGSGKNSEGSQREVGRGLGEETRGRRVESGDGPDRGSIGRDASAEEVAHAFASPKQKTEGERHLVASAKVTAQELSDKLLASARGEALKLRRAGWDDDEIEEALKIHLGELSEADLKRAASQRLNEGFSLGRVAAGEDFKKDVEVAIYSAILDNHVCKVCEALDGREFAINSEAYEEHMPPNANCEGGDQCRCTYIYVLKGTKLSDVALADWDESQHPRDDHGRFSDKWNELSAHLGIDPDASLRESLEALESDSGDRDDVVDRQTVLDQFGAKTHTFPGGQEVTVASDDGKDYVVDDYSLIDASEWVDRINDPTDYYPDHEDRFNEDFWSGGGGDLWHATQDENRDSILRDGIEARSETRGFSNRSVGPSVFTADDPEALADGSYGDTLLKIDMSKVPSKPFVSREPPVVERELRGAIAHRIGLRNYEPPDGSDWSGEVDTTVIVHGSIPPQAITVVDTGSSRRMAEWDESQHPRDEDGKFAPTDRDAVQDRLKKLVSGQGLSAHVSDQPSTTRAAVVVADTLEEMKAQGYMMPTHVMVATSMSDAIRASVTNIVEANKDYRYLDVHLPDRLPQDADLDLAVATAFGGDISAPGDPLYARYEKFSSRTMQDIVVHEMGHVQAGHRERLDVSQLVRNNEFESPHAVNRAMLRVSAYASTNVNEFLAEAFTRLYRGEKLADDSMKLYKVLNGPEVRP